MCGIAGRVNLFSGAPVARAAIAQMNACIAHRGPDGDGILVDGMAGFGHRRLAIIDLTAAGDQPMVSPDGRYWIVFNGEIYNFHDVRRALEQRGHVFVSRSDTEVLLHAFAEYGPTCVERLRGMFAFAVWDTLERRLTLVRDRLGKKPLFYRRHQDGLSFASESKSLVAEPDFERRVNEEAVAHYLALSFVPAPLSGFAGIEVVPPAHILTADASGVRVQRYWRLQYEPKQHINEREAAEAVAATLREAVRLRLISDVPLGAFLSGGVDSGTIVALMSQLGGHGGRVRTFSIGFGEAEFSELEQARRVAERYGTDHHELVVTPDIADVLPRIVWHYGEPYADPSAVPTYYLAQMARRHVTVALNGDAGDENFAGYDCYPAALAAPSFDGWPDSVRSLIRAGARAASAAAGSAFARPGRAMNRLRAMTLEADVRYADGRCFFTRAQLAELLTPDFRARSAGPATAQRLAADMAGLAATDPLDRMLAFDIEHYLPDCLLAKVDVATMAHGLEARAPFLDHVFMELVATLPAAFKLKGGVKKFLLKQVARELLPPEILDRPKKGFSLPIDPWLRGDLRPMVMDTLLGARFLGRGVVERDAVSRLLQEHFDGVRPWHEQIWNLLMLELWWRQFIDDRPEPVPAGRL